MAKEIRWQQRFSNFNSALAQLAQAIVLSHQRELSNLEQQGTIQAFEYTYEIAWNLLKDFYEYQGTQGIQGSRDAVREAFNKGLITEGEVWFDMIKKRSLTVHTYNQELSQEIFASIVTSYYPQFVNLAAKLQQYLDEKH
jgi:nucleotidyltransferase substrate binding protein (TIGR01987 family)